MAFYAERHPGALTARYEATRFPEQPSALASVGHGLANYVHDLNVWRWVRDGDPSPYIHVAGTGQLYAATVVLAVAGVVVLVRGRRLDAWWVYVLAVLLLTPVPAALTEDRLHSTRLAPVPAILAVVAIPGLAALVGAARRVRWAQVAAAALVLVTVAAARALRRRLRRARPELAPGAVRGGCADAPRSRVRPRGTGLR